jgi:biotin carboxylase
MAHLVFVESTRPGIRALEVARALGHRVTYVTSHRMDWLFGEADRANLRRHADRIVEVSDAHDADVLTEALRAVAAEEAIDAALSTLHQFVEPTAIAARRIGARGTSVEGIHHARNKARCRELLREAGIPSVKHQVVRSADETIAALREIGYPAILKPTTGVGKVLTQLVTEEAQVIAHFEQAACAHAELRPGVREEISLEFVLEEFAHGPLYSVELGVSASGEHVPFAILKRKVGKHNPVLEMGSTIPSDLSAAQLEAAAAYCTEVVKALGLDLGIFHIELIYTEQGPRLVEVNPRIAGGAIPDLIRTATGGDLFEYLIRIYAGERAGIPGFTCRGATSHTFIAAFDDCTVRADLPADWFEPFKARISSGAVDLVGGQALRKMDGNYDLYGVVRVTGPDYGSAIRATEQLRLDVQAQLGVRLVEVVD